MPKISVIMGIYNCEATLSEAIDCIINQTLTDWELVMCDDGSSDETCVIAEEYQQRFPDKIVVLKNERNRGLNETLNKCLKYAKGTYIARMDADDLCKPSRFEVEAEILDKDHSVAIVSSDMLHFDESGYWGRETHPDYPTKMDFLRGTPFCHAPCMVRAEVYRAVEGYSVGERLLRVEDYHLWLKMYKKGYKGCNIHQVLYFMRDDRNAYSRRKFRYRLNEAYVKKLAIKEFKLPIIGYIHVLRPILVGLLPNFIYDKLHKHKLREEEIA